MADSPQCYSCGNDLSGLPVPTGRSEVCPKCMADVRVCKNCAHYDINSYNECHEPQAERVVDKEKGTFCDYFRLSGGSEIEGSPSKEDTLADLDNLFKK